MKRFSLAAIVIAVLCLVGWSLQVRQKWEYKILSTMDDRKLNELGMGRMGDNYRLAARTSRRIYGEKDFKIGNWYTWRFYIVTRRR